MKNSFGNYLMWQLRESDGTMTEHANQIGVDRGSFSHHLAGRSVPKIRVLRKYAKAYGVDVRYLIDLIKDDRGYYNG